MSKTTILLVMLATAAACGEDEGKPPEKLLAETAKDVVTPDAPAPARPRAAAPKSDNEVDLTFTGAFTATLKGKAGMCSRRKSGPILGSTWQVHSVDLGVSKPAFDFTIITEPKTIQNPAMVVNVKGEQRASYNRPLDQEDARLALAEDATSAEIDVVLKKVAGKDTLHVVGSIKCAKPDVFE